MSATGQQSRIRSSLNAVELAGLAARQVNNLFPDGRDVAAGQLGGAVDEALRRLTFCFSHVENKYFFVDGAAQFNHLHGDQYAMWLYFLANSLHRQQGPVDICSKLFLLNKALHGCDLFHEVELPDIFLLVHPLGTVLGRGRYGNFLVAYQRCGVGSNRDVFPELGEHVSLRPGSAILGRCRIGSMVQVASESLVLDHDLPDNTLYIGNPGQFRTKPHKTAYPLWRTKPSP